MNYRSRLPFMKAIPQDLAKELERKPTDQGMPFVFYDEWNLHEEPPSSPRSQTATADLRKAISGSMMELLHRAHAQQPDAVRSLIDLAKVLTNELRILAKKNPDLVSAFARSESEWPVLLSLNPKTIKHAKEHLEELKVGDEAFLQSY